MNVEGKAAIVTGGGSGVGRATALELASRGCSVLINYSKSKEEAEDTAQEIRELGVAGIAVRADVADDAACRGMVATAEREFGRLDILVNNAGTTVFVPHFDLDSIDTSDWQRIMGVNVVGAFQCARAAKALLDKAESGHIVNTSSVAGVGGVGSSIPYCASKAALNNLTVTLARVFAPRIKVNAVAPGFITGRWLEQGMGDNYEMMQQLAAARSALQKVCTPEEVAAAIIAIITGPDLMTGQVLVTDSGLLLGNGT
jgi:3-oxoacyl-[acyl-carrier protein] reductase